VTAALGAAASAQISLTDRRHASRVVFVTAHREGGTGLRNERHIAGDTTYVIYMPGHRYAELSKELQAAGLAAETPCAVISRATTADESVFRTTVSRLKECPAAASPSLIVVGIVAGIDAHETAARETQFSSKRNEEIMQLAQQHPYHDSHGRGSVEQ
jgi:uroporphyrin-III C-methyltransferase